MPDDRLKVIFTRLYVIDDADWVGSGEFYFIATVDGVTVGDRSRIFNAVERTWINLPAAQWTTIVNLHGKSQVVVRFQGKDQDVISDDDLGTVGFTLRPPWSQRYFRQRTPYYILEWSVELEVDGAFGMHPPNMVYACREHNGSVDCTTVSGTGITARLEIHPVRPVPATGLPTRGPFPPPGTGGPDLNIFGTDISPGDPLNVVPNPSVIPILSPPAPPPPPGAAPAPAAAPPPAAPPPATLQNAARIEYTYYQPSSLAFADDDPRLEWTARTAPGATGGSVVFLDPALGTDMRGPAHGLKAFVYGTAAGEVLLEVRFRGALMATYRALVLDLKSIPCRCNILNGPTHGSTPRATPANVVDHLAIANRYLYQMGLQLVLDTDRHLANGATRTEFPGVFRIAVSETTTAGIHMNDPNLPATILNYRPRVMNFVYAHSDNGSGADGAATNFPDSLQLPPPGSPPGTRPTITDSGTPSNSWTPHTGIPPDAAADPTTMSLLTGHPRPHHPHLYAMLLFNNLGDPAVLADQRRYAMVMCHEFGHILNLGHRLEGVPESAPGAGDGRTMTAADPPAALVVGGIFWDGLLYPPLENIMLWTGFTGEDFDIIQARAVRMSPLVPH